MDPFILSAAERPRQQLRFGVSPGAPHSTAARMFLSSNDTLLLVIEHLDIPSLQKLSQVCVAWTCLARDELRRRVYLELKRHIFTTATTHTVSSYPLKDAIEGFLVLLRTTRSVVSGSTALAICMQGTSRAGDWMDERDLDVFTPVGLAPNVILYFVETLGYVVARRLMGRAADDDVFGINDGDDVDSDEEDDNAFGTAARGLGVMSVTRLIRDGGLRVDVVEADSDCAILPVARFPFTALVNYITSTSLVVCYPRLTLTDLRMHYNPGISPPNRFKDKYRARGWVSSQEFQHTHQCIERKHYCPRNNRISEDDCCLVFDFEPRGGWYYPLEHVRTVSYYPQASWRWGDWSSTGVHDEPYAVSRYSALTTH
ncbi:hypothetical protein PENSPDRAFT_688058 [Peniophora sp. CONT]|nr:hypothetical protein PENSPDRAFT_688058 [Peniophora sp. CONT]